MKLSTPKMECCLNKLRTTDLFGSGAKYATVEEMNKLLDKLRDEDEQSSL